MKNYSSSHLDIIKNLLFSIKETFKSSPVCFIVSAAIQLLNTVSYYVILYFSRNILNTLNDSLSNRLSFNESITQISIWVILSAVFSILLIFANYFKNVMMQKQQLAFKEYVNIKLAKKSMELDISYFDNPKYYDKIAQAQEGKTRLGFIVYRVIFFITNATSFVIALSIAFSLSHWIFPLFILALTFPALLTRGKYYKQKYEYEQDQQGVKRKIGYLARLILGKNAAKEVRFYEMEDFLCEKYRRHWCGYASGLRKIIIKRGAIDSFFTVLPVFGIMFSMYFVVMKIGSGGANIGDFTYLLSIYSSVSSSFLNLVEDLAKMGESEYAIQKYNEFMAAEPNVVYQGSLPVETVETIEFKDVCFTYPETDKLVLDHISFKLDAKKRNAIVGVNGSGKTTIVKLLLRFYDADSGQILINGVDICEYDIHKIRKVFSAVFQDYVVYSLSIRDNVSFSDYENRHDDAKIEKALDFAEIKEDIFSKTSDFDTFLSRDFTEDGIELSGGQRQKIAIARCAFNQAQVLVMDEPSASLDPKAEYNILSKLNKLYENKGLIMISHRLSNMKTMDYILVINEGRVMEAGSHGDLMRAQNQYYQMYTIQADKYRTEGETQACAL